MRAINLPTPAAREAYDRAFAEARGTAPWPRESSTKVSYQLLSRGALPEDPGGLLTKVHAGDSRALDAAIQWLRFDPFCLWSGYLKRDLMRSLVRQNKTLDPRERKASPCVASACCNAAWLA